MRRILQSIMFLQGLLCAVALMGLATAADADTAPNAMYWLQFVKGLSLCAASIVLTAALQWAGNRLRG